MLLSCIFRRVDEDDEDEGDNANLKPDEELSDPVLVNGACTHTSHTHARSGEVELIRSSLWPDVADVSASEHVKIISFLLSVLHCGDLCVQVMTSEIRTHPQTRAHTRARARAKLHTCTV